MKHLDPDEQAQAEPVHPGSAGASPCKVQDSQPDRLTGTESLGHLVCLDLGTDTGVCLKRPGMPLRSRTLCLATDSELELQRREDKDRTLDIRFARIFDFAREQIRLGARGFVIEDVGFCSTRMATQLWASLRSAIWAAALLQPGIQIYCVPVATLKQFAARNNSAQKAEMAEALAKVRPGDYKIVAGQIQKTDGTLIDHNEVDAIWLALYAEAVERGQRTFVGPHRRKLMIQSERRLRKAQRKQKAKLRKAACALQEKAKQHAIRVALKSLPRCCGVYRKQDRNQAVCPKCGSRVNLPRIRTPAVLPAITDFRPSPQPSTHV